MITQHKSRSRRIEPVFISGLSTDEKPLDVANGSRFDEMDTGKSYRFDEENKKWLVNYSGSGGGGGSGGGDDDEDVATKDDIQGIINNIYA